MTTPTPDTAPGAEQIEHTPVADKRRVRAQFAPGGNLRVVTDSRPETPEETGRRLKIAADDAKEAYDAWAAEYKESHPVGTETYAAAGVKIALAATPKAKANVEARARLLAERPDEFGTLVFDLEKAKKKLTGEQLDALYIAGEPKLTLTVLDKDA